MGIAEHRKCIRHALERHIDRCEQLPHLIVHGAASIGTLRADRSTFDIVMVQEVHGGKEIRALTLRSRSPIGGEQRKEIIIIRPALRARQKIVKKRLGTFVILPKYTAIVRHLNLLRQREHLPVVADPL